MPAQFKIYPLVAGLVAGLLYVLMATVGAPQQTVAENRLLLHPPRDLQGVYAGQLDRYVANELEVLTARSAVEKAAQAVGASPEEVQEAASAVIEPGTDVVVLKVSGLGDGRDQAAAQSIVKTYTEEATARAQSTTDKPAKDLKARIAELEKRINTLSEEISRAQRGKTNTEPSVVAPLANSQRTLLMNQHSELTNQLMTLETQGGTSGPSVQVISTSNTADGTDRALSPFTLAAAVLGGAALGFVLALLQTRLRRKAGSWSEVETALRGRDWVAVGAPARQHGASPLTDHLVRRLMERSAQGRSSLVEIVDHPGSPDIRRQAEDAAATVGRLAPQSAVRIVTTDAKTLSPDALCVVPYRKGSLGKGDLRALASHAPRDAELVLADVSGAPARTSDDGRTA